MSEAPEEFEQLRRLLKIKAYEQPPPGFFNNFAPQVVAAIRSEPEPAFLDRLWEEAPWLKRLFGVLETNPLAAGGFATTLCAILVGGIVYSQYLDQSPQLISVNSDGTIHVPSATTASLASAKATDPFVASVSATNFYNNNSASAMAPAFDPFKAASPKPQITPVDFNP